jgi:group II intron maturase
LPIPFQFKIIFESWFKSKLIDFSVFYKEAQGIPEESGILTSLLINFGLDGLEKILLCSVNSFIPINRESYYLKKFNINNLEKNMLDLKLIRFLNDIVIISNSEFSLINCITFGINNFLKVRNLQLNNIVQQSFSTLENSNFKLSYLGYDFFYRNKKVENSKNSFSNNLKKEKIVLIPQYINLYSICRKLRSLFHFNIHKSSAELILIVNPIIIKWCLYFRLGQSFLHYRYLECYVHFLC